MGIEVALLGLAVAGTVHSIDQQKAAGRDQERGRKAQQRIQDVKSARERRKQVRAAQRAQSELALQGQTKGAGGSSAVVGGASSIQTQLQSNLSFLSQTTQLAQQASIFGQRAADHKGSAGTGQAVAGLALQGASIFGGPAKPEITG